MITFVNRQTELTLINNAFEALRSKDADNFLRTPIIGFFGVAGIGKTSVLEYVAAQCKEQKLCCIRINENRDASYFSREIVRQIAEHYHISAPFFDEEDDPFQQSVYVTKALLEQGAVVMVLDGVDTTNDDLLRRIATTLRDLIDHNKLFVVLASKEGVLFDSERALSRKLTSLQLKPIDQKNCTFYLNSIDPSLKAETRDTILKWTGGYPLALEVMTRVVIEQKLDPTQQADQLVLIDILIEQVIDHKILAGLAPIEQAQYKDILSVLSVPRHFNLSIMQKLIERFVPAMKRNNDLAYMKLPASIKNDTGVLSWNIFRGWFTIDAPIRTIFLLVMQLKQQEKYLAIHQFLSQLNQALAHEVKGSDVAYYFCEYLYHSAYVKSQSEFLSTLQHTLSEITRVQFESFDTFETFQQYLEDLSQDGQFVQALDEQAPTVQSLIYQQLAELSQREAFHSSDEERIAHLQNMLIYSVYSLKNPTAADLSPVLRPVIRRMLAATPESDTQQFVAELLTHEQLKEKLAPHFDVLAQLLTEIATEGHADGR